MRDYGRVYSGFWTSADIRALSEDARTLAFYLLTSPHTTLIGAMRLPDGYACEDLNWTADRVQKGFDELLRKGYANRCETTKWVWIRKFLSWNAPENPNQWKAANKIASQVPMNCSWRAEFSAAYVAAGGAPLAGGINPLPTVTKRFGNQKQKQESEQDQEQNTETRARVWATVRETYPAGTYREVTWMNAERRFLTLIDEGHDPRDLGQAVDDYRAQQEAKRAIGSQYVLSPEKFFSDDNWRGPFPLPATKAQIAQDANINAGLAWLAGSSSAGNG